MQNCSHKEKLKEKTAQLKTNIPAVFLALKDSETPIIAKFIAAITVCYALSPIDLIPDFVPVLGYIDDLIILPALVTLVVKFIPKEVWDRGRKSAAEMWKDGKPKKWFYSIPVILFWILIVLILIRLIIVPAVMK